MRFVMARKRRGANLWNVADACQIARRRYWGIERGHQQPTEAELARIADWLRFPARFFFRPPIHVPTIDEVNPPTRKKVAHSSAAGRRRR